ncbi:MAG TPA: hypothetical protein VI197_17230 [Polyangiaceae bacterium]
MHDPERLLDQGTDFERALLRGGCVERPSARMVRRMALGAGVGGALSYTSNAQALLETWWGKTVTVALVGGGVAVGVAGALRSGVPAGTLPEAAPPDRAARVEPPVAPREDRPAASPAEAPERALSAPTPAPAEARSLKPRPRSPKPAGSLAEEVKQLDRVRALMARGARAAALRELDGYDQRYPDGTLRREARVLRTRVSEQR